ncbi:MAG: cell wall-binding repeat-containing protein, partial [Coriobacteriales bacterium]|nr:cell wall-binding repeat-containing protein [Coriobacteriales bacterium]
MKSLNRILAVSVLTLVLVFSFTFVALAANGENNQNFEDTTHDITEKGFTRFDGTGRYDTMKKIVEEECLYPSSPDGKPCVLARGDDYPDALAATAFAGLFDGAIVLTPSDAATLPDKTIEALQKISPSDIWVPGGAIASHLIQQAIDITGATYHSPMAGSGRTATSLKIYQTGKTESFTHNWADTAILANSLGYADALSASPLAYKMHYPVFLTDSYHNLSSDIKNAIQTGGFNKAIILGGTSAVSESAEADLIDVVGQENVTRLGGAGRIATSAIVADYCVKQGALDYTHLCVARGDDFPDALSMGPLCGKAGSALMLSYTDSDFSNVLSQVQNNYKNMQACYIAGGTSSISDRVFNQLEETISMPEHCPYICFTADVDGGSTVKFMNDYTDTL